MYGSSCRRAPNLKAVSIIRWPPPRFVSCGLERQVRTRHDSSPQFWERANCNRQPGTTRRAASGSCAPAPSYVQICRRRVSQAIAIGSRPPIAHHVLRSRVVESATPCEVMHREPRSLELVGPPEFLSSHPALQTLLLRLAAAVSPPSSSSTPPSS